MTASGTYSNAVPSMSGVETNFSLYALIDFTQQFEHYFVSDNLGSNPSCNDTSAGAVYLDQIGNSNVADFISLIESPSAAGAVIDKSYKVSSTSWLKQSKVIVVTLTPSNYIDSKNYTNFFVLDKSAKKILAINVALQPAYFGDIIDHPLFYYYTFFIE